MKGGSGGEKLRVGCGRGNVWSVSCGGGNQNWKTNIKGRTCDVVEKDGSDVVEEDEGADVVEEYEGAGVW
jgi:hypothetical protein